MRKMHTSDIGIIIIIGSVFLDSAIDMRGVDDCSISESFWSCDVRNLQNDEPE
jgi:hypothetical protein